MSDDLSPLMAENPAFRCHGCHGDPDWSLLRRGDVVIDWACHAHLAAVCASLQRDHEITELVVKDYRKATEWGSIGRSLNTIAEGPQP